MPEASPSRETDIPSENSGLCMKMAQIPNQFKTAIELKPTVIVYKGKFAKHVQAVQNKTLPNQTCGAICCGDFLVTREQLK